MMTPPVNSPQCSRALLTRFMRTGHPVPAHSTSRFSATTLGGMVLALSRTVAGMLLVLFRPVEGIVLVLPISMPVVPRCIHLPSPAWLGLCVICHLALPRYSRLVFLQLPYHLILVHSAQEAPLRVWRQGRGSRGCFCLWPAVHRCSRCYGLPGGHAWAGSPRPPGSPVPGCGLLGSHLGHQRRGHPPHQIPHGAGQSLIRSHMGQVSPSPHPSWGRSAPVCGLLGAPDLYPRLLGQATPGVQWDAGQSRGWGKIADASISAAITNCALLCAGDPGLYSDRRRCAVTSGEEHFKLGRHAAIAGSWLVLVPHCSKPGAGQRPWGLTSRSPERAVVSPRREMIAHGG